MILKKDETSNCKLSNANGESTHFSSKISFSGFDLLTLRSSHKSNSRRFCGSWFATVNRMFALAGVIDARILEIIQTIRENCLSQFAEDDLTECTSSAN